ncbi:hypothetical protein ACLOJK_041320 [Asimina triloba]
MIWVRKAAITLKGVVTSILFVNAGRRDRAQVGAQAEGPSRQLTDGESEMPPVIVSGETCDAILRVDFLSALI